ncbi:DUF1907-domain-containing protein, partial [Mollisia scopiformis]
MPTKHPTTTHPLPPTSLSNLISPLLTSLKQNFTDATISLVPCPNLTQPPFHLAAPGLSGHEAIVDIGGPAYLHPVPDFSKKYDLGRIVASLSSGEEKGKGRLAIGAGAGPFHIVGQNSELIPNFYISASGNVTKNLTHYAKIDPSTQTCIAGPVPGASTAGALMANLFLSDGDPGPVLRITARNRIGDKSFTEAMRMGIEEREISMGGVFVVEGAKVWAHVMPDFCGERLEDAEVGKWLRFFEWGGEGLVFLSCFHGVDFGVGVRVEHTH